LSFASGRFNRQSNRRLTVPKSGRPSEGGGFFVDRGRGSVVHRIRQMVQTTYLTLEITEEYAKTKANLRKAGYTVDDFDTLIGATAIVNNLRHFENIAGLLPADWP